MDQTLLIAIICFTLGLVSFCFAIISAATQGYTICKTNNTSGSSLITYIIFWICPIICLTWCMIFYLNNATLPQPETVPLWLKQWELIPLILTYMFDFILLSYIVVVKIHHIRLSKKLKMSEFQLGIYLTKKKKYEYIKSGKKFWKHPFFQLFAVFAIAAIILFIFTLAFVILGPYPDFNVYFDQDIIGVVIPVLSIAGAVMWELISWPQFIVAIRTKNTSGISVGWAIFFPCTCVVSFTYSLSLAFISGDFTFNSIGGIVFNGMIVNFGILIIKLINIAKAKKKGMNEIQYTQKVLIPTREAWLKAHPKLTKKQKAKIKKQKLIKEALEARKIAQEISRQKDLEWKVRACR